MADLTIESPQELAYYLLLNMDPVPLETQAGLEGRPEDQNLLQEQLSVILCLLEKSWVLHPMLNLNIDKALHP